MNFSLGNLSLTGNAISDYLGGTETSFLTLTGNSVLIAVAIILISLALYVYLSIAYSKIGEKAKLGSPGIAWSPMGSLVVIFESAKMHWWPFLMLTIGISLGYLLMFLGSLIGIILASIIIGITMLLFMIMVLTWHWKTYEAVGKPGWWILVPVISGALGFVLVIVGVIIGTSIIAIIGGVIAALGIIVHFVLIGIAAWSESEGGGNSQNYKQNYNYNQVPTETQPERGYEEESYGQE
jgi:hypothetical protein